MIRRPREEEPTINLTPMIDVVFLLLIFFLAGSSFTKPEGHIPINVPGVGGLKPVARGADPRTVEIDRTGMISLDGKPTNLAQLANDLGTAAKVFPEIEVVVRADGTGAVQGVAEVLQTARAAGVRHLNFAVQSRY